MREVGYCLRRRVAAAQREVATVQVYVRALAAAMRRHGVTVRSDYSARITVPCCPSQALASATDVKMRVSNGFSGLAAYMREATTTSG